MAEEQSISTDVSTEPAKPDWYDEYVTLTKDINSKSSRSQYSAWFSFYKRVTTWPTGCVCWKGYLNSKGTFDALWIVPNGLEVTPTEGLNINYFINKYAKHPTIRSRMPSSGLARQPNRLGKSAASRAKR